MSYLDPSNPILEGKIITQLIDGWKELYQIGPYVEQAELLIEEISQVPKHLEELPTFLKRVVKRINWDSVSERQKIRQL